MLTKSDYIENSSSNSITLQQLKNYYLLQNSPPSLFEEDENSPEQRTENNFINLAIVKSEEQKNKEVVLLQSKRAKYEENLVHNTYKEIHTAKETINIRDIFDIPSKRKSQVTKILVSGIAGSGKTTLIRNIAYRWAIGDLWDNKFKYIFCLPLKQLISGWEKLYSGNPIGLAHFIHHCCFSNEDIEIKEIKDILKNKEALLLLDGYDEVANISNSNKALIEAIINSALIYPYVIMTSRFNFIPLNIQSKFDAEVEIIGFLKQDIKGYINKYYNHNEELGSTLKKFLSSNKEVLELCHTPINLALICYIWGDPEYKEKLEKDIFTFTDLYCQVTEKLMKRYISKVLKLDVTNIRGQEVEDKLSREYTVLEKIAYLAVKKGEIVIGKDIFDQLNIQSEDYEKLKQIGFLKVLAEGKKILNKEHYFIHSTFQEYFAARHLVRMLSSNEEKFVREAVKFIEQNKYCKVYERIMWFTAGLSNRNEQALFHFWNVLVNGNVDLGVIKQTILIIRALEEAKLNSNIPELYKIINYIRKVVEKAYNQEEIITCLNNSQRVLNKIQLIKYLISNLSNENNNEIESSIETLQRLNIQNDEQLKEVIYKFISNLHSSNDKIKSLSFWGLGLIYYRGKNLPHEFYEILLDSLENEEISSDVESVLLQIKINNKEMLEKVVRILSRRIEHYDNTTKYLFGTSAYKLKIKNQVTNKLCEYFDNKFKNEEEGFYNYIFLNLGLRGHLKLPEDRFNILILSSALMLSSNNKEDRKNALKVLNSIELKNETIIKLLAQLLIGRLSDENEDKDIKLDILKLLGALKIQGEEIVKKIITTLIPQLASEEKEIFFNSLVVLNTLPINNSGLLSQLSNILILRLEDKDPVITNNIIIYLGKLIIEDKQTLHNIVAAIIAKLPYKDVRSAAIHSLCNLSINHPYITKDLINSFILELNHKKEDTACIIHVLSHFKINTTEIYKALITKIDDKDISNHALMALGKLRIEDKIILNTVVNILLTKLEDENPNSRVCAARALYEIIKRESPYIQDISLELIKKINNEDSQVYPILVKSLKKIRISNYDLAHKVIEALAFKALSYSQGDDIFPIITKLLSNYPSIKLNDTLWTLLPQLLPEMNVTISINNLAIIIFQNLSTKIKYLSSVCDLQIVTQIFFKFYNKLEEQGLPTDMLDNMLRCRKMISIPRLGINVDDIILSNTILTHNKYSMVDNRFVLNCNNWVISLVRKDNKFTHDPQHTFILLEGRNILNGAIIHRIELTRPNADNDPKRTAIQIDPHENISLFNLERTFQIILGNKKYPEEKFEAGKHYYSKSCSISYEACMRLLKEVEEDKINPPVYNIRGNDGISVPEGEHSCFTWAREKLRRYLSSEEYEAMGLDSWRDIIASYPSHYLGNDKGKKREPITLI